MLFKRLLGKENGIMFLEVENEAITNFEIFSRRI